MFPNPAIKGLVQGNKFLISLKALTLKTSGYLYMISLLNEGKNPSGDVIYFFNNFNLFYY